MLNYVNPISATANNNVFVILRVSFMQIQPAKKRSIASLRFSIDADLFKHGISPSKAAGFYRMTNRLSVMGNVVKHLIAVVQIGQAKFANRSFAMLRMTNSKIFFN